MEYLNIAILLLSCIFEVYIYYDFFYAYFDFREFFQSRFRRVSILLFAIMGLFFVNLLGKSYVNILGFIVIIWISLVAIFISNIGSRIIYFVIALIVGSGCEFVFGILLSVPMYIQKQQSVVNLSDIPWHMFTMKLMTYILLAVIKQFFGNSKVSLSPRLFINYLLIPIAIFGIMLLTYYTSLDASVNQFTKALFCMSFSLMLLGNIIIFRAFNNYSDELYLSTEQKLIITRQNMDLNYYSQIQNMDNRYQAFNHDLSHHLKTIGELAKEKQIDSILSIINDLNIELESNVLTIYCNNPVINSVLSEKKSIAEKNEEKMDIYVEPGFSLGKISDTDIISMLSNLLDNAIRAVENSDNKVITVRLYTENQGCFNIVKIENHFTGELIRSVFGFETTKKEKGMHGIGIKSVANTAEKYNGYLECFDNNYIFTAVLVLPAF